MFIGKRLQNLVCIIVFEIFFLSLSDAYIRCEGKPHNCCEGYMWSTSIEDCIKCKIGYYGMNCSSPCPPPTFGLDCQTLCPCENDICNHITGCMLERGTTESLTQSTADLHVLRNQPASMNSLMTVGISSLAILSTVIFVVYIGLKIFPRNKKTVRHLDIELMDLSQSKNNPCKT